MTYLAFLYLLSAMVQAQEPVWLHAYGNGNDNMGFNLAYDGASGLYGVGRVRAPELNIGDTTLTVLGFEDVLIAKWDTSGNLIWARTAGGICQTENEGGGRAVYDHASDQVIISGAFDCASTAFGNHELNGSEAGGKNRFIASYNGDGECQWARSASGFDIHFYELLIDDASQIFVVGSSEVGWITFQGATPIILPQGGFIAKYSGGGAMMHAEQVVVNGELADADWVSTNNWILAGLAKPNASIFGTNLSPHSTQHDGFVARTDSSGVVAWVTMFPSNGSSSIWRVAALPDGRSAVSGYFVDDLLLPQDTLFGAPGVWTHFLALVDMNGTVEWAFPLESEELAYIADLKVDQDGDILLYGHYSRTLTFGSCTLTPFSSTNAFVARLSANGDCNAAWGFGRTYFPSGSVLPTAHGLYLSSGFDSTLVLGSTTVQGTHTGPDPGYHDLLIARFDSLSGFTHVPSTTAVASEGLLIYANPNDGRSTIGVPSVIPAGSTVRLIVRNAHGQLVLEEPVVLDGRGTLQLDISTQAKGMYHVELLNEERRYTGKVVVE